MIPVSAKRNAARCQLEQRIRSQPCSARFRKWSLSVFTSEPQATRQMRTAGMDPSVTLEAHIVLPFGAARPQAEKDFIEVADFSGELNTYRIVTVTALLGFDCYKLDLRSNRETTARPLRFGVPPS